LLAVVGTGAISGAGLSPRASRPDFRTFQIV
jgi:hypothetical protein